MYFAPMLVLFAAVVAVIVLVGTFVVHHNNALGFLGHVLLRVLGPAALGVVMFFGLAVLVTQSILHGNDLDDPAVVTVLHGNSPDNPAAVTMGCVVIVAATCAGVLRGCVVCRDIAIEHSVARDAVSWSYRIAAALVFPAALVVNMAVSQIPMTASNGGDPMIAGFAMGGFMIYLFGFCLVVTVMIALYGAFCEKPAAEAK